MVRLGVLIRLKEKLSLGRSVNVGRSMDNREESYRFYLLSLASKLRCTPGDLSGMYHFDSDAERILQTLVYENENV